MGNRVVYGKLVRDNIPAKLAAKNLCFKTHSLTGEAFEAMVLLKVLEEASEVAEAKSREELVAELADLREVMDALMRIHNITPDELRAAQDAALAEKGGFDTQTFLEWIEE